MAMMPEMPGMAPNMSPVKMPRPRPDGFRSEDGNEPCTDVREHVASPVVGLAEQDAGRGRMICNEVERHVIE